MAAIVESNTVGASNPPITSESPIVINTNSSVGNGRLVPDTSTQRINRLGKQFIGINAISFAIFLTGVGCSFATAKKLEGESSYALFVFGGLLMSIVQLSTTYLAFKYKGKITELNINALSNEAVEQKINKLGNRFFWFGIFSLVFCGLGLAGTLTAMRNWKEDFSAILLVLEVFFRFIALGGSNYAFYRYERKLKEIFVPPEPDESDTQIMNRV